MAQAGNNFIDAVNSFKAKSADPLSNTTLGARQYSEPNPVSRFFPLTDSQLLAFTYQEKISIVSNTFAWGGHGIWGRNPSTDFITRMKNLYTSSNDASAWQTGLNSYNNYNTGSGDAWYDFNFTTSDYVAIASIVAMGATAYLSAPATATPSQYALTTGLPTGQTGLIAGSSVSGLTVSGATLSGFSISPAIMQTGAAVGASGAAVSTATATSSASTSSATTSTATSVAKKVGAAGLKAVGKGVATAAVNVAVGAAMSALAPSDPPPVISPEQTSAPNSFDDIMVAAAALLSLFVLFK